MKKGSTRFPPAVNVFLLPKVKVNGEKRSVGQKEMLDAVTSVWASASTSNLK